MGDVTKGEGRTVLFVSHNMTSVKELCNNGILMKNGMVNYQGDILETILEYQKDYELSNSYLAENIEKAVGNENIKILEFSAKPINGKIIDVDSGIRIKLEFYNNLPNINLDATFELRNFEELVIFHVGKLISENYNAKKGIYSIEFDMPAGMLNAGNYYFKLMFGKNQTEALFTIDNLIGFEVENVKVGTKTHIYPGIIRPNFDYKIDSKID